MEEMRYPGYEDDLKRIYELKVQIKTLLGDKVTPEELPAMAELQFMAETIMNQINNTVNRAIIRRGRLTGGDFVCAMKLAVCAVVKERSAVSTVPAKADRFSAEMFSELASLFAAEAEKLRRHLADPDACIPPLADVAEVQ